MWAWLAGRVLRNRAAILIVIGLLTCWLGYEATKVGMSYKHGGLLPKIDSAYVEYDRFLSTFKEDGNVLVVGTQGEGLYTPEHFKAWYDLGNDLHRITGVDSVFSEAHLFTLYRDDSLQRFQLKQVVTAPPRTRAEMDSLYRSIRRLPFYRGLLYDAAGDDKYLLFSTKNGTAGHDGSGFGGKHVGSGRQPWSQPSAMEKPLSAVETLARGLD